MKVAVLIAFPLLGHRPPCASPGRQPTTIPQAVMTNQNLTSQVITDDKLEGLCKVLAQDRYQPSAVQVLYFLLQPAVEHNVQQWSQLGEAIRESHHQNMQISTFGTVPDWSSLKASDNQDREESVWGVASLYADEKFAEPRARFWISTETNARPSKNSDDQPKWQPDEQSLAILDTMFRTFFRPFLQTHGGSSIFFNGTNQCWTEHLGGLGSNVFDNHCSKAVRKFDLHAESQVECPPGYRIRPLEEKDIQTVSTASSYQRKVIDSHTHSRSSHRTKSRSRRRTLGPAYSYRLPLSTMRQTNSLHGHSPTPTVRLSFPHYGIISNVTDIRRHQSRSEPYIRLLRIGREGLLRLSSLLLGTGYEKPSPRIGLRRK
jgi:hypothetical protein